MTRTAIFKRRTHGKLDSFQVTGSSSVDRGRSALRVLNAKLWKDATRSHCHVRANVHTEGSDDKFMRMKTQVGEVMVDDGSTIDVWGFSGHGDHIRSMVLRQLTEKRLIL